MATAAPEPHSGVKWEEEDAEERSNRELRQLPDQLLQGKLQRMQQTAHSYGYAAAIHDGGEKWLLSLGAVRREIDRRKAEPSSEPPPPRPFPCGRQGEPADGETGERTVDQSSMFAVSSDIQVTSSLHAQVETPAWPSKQLRDEHVMEPKLKPCIDLQQVVAEDQKIIPLSFNHPFFTSSLPQVESHACLAKQPRDEHVMKPKLKPCNDSLQAVAEDQEITPLSGDHPFFTVVMSRSHVQRPFQMIIPVRFQRHFPKAYTPVTLLSGGKSWSMSYRGDLKSKKFDKAWMGFVADNRLQINDACVFEMVRGTRRGEEVVFQVQILSGRLPDEFTPRGATADKPIVIDILD